MSINMFGFQNGATQLLYSYPFRNRRYLLKIAPCRILKPLHLKIYYKIKDVPMYVTYFAGED